MVQKRAFAPRREETRVTFQEASEAAAYIRERTTHQPALGLVLGSGLGLLADRVRHADAMPYAAIPHFPPSTVPGHSGRLVVGELVGVPVLVMQGRIHFYEGHGASRITLPIRTMQILGIDTLLVTNAAGGVNRSFCAGDLMAITDHVYLPGMAGHHPLLGPNDDRFGPRFPDMSTPYDPELLMHLQQEAQMQGIALKEGVYMMVSGPSFETPAEVRMIRALGADAVGMSTAPEVIVARHAGMRVMGLSLITNMAVDEVRFTPNQADVHQEVLEAGRKAVPQLVSLLEGVIKRLASPD
jgi:purine-nucleoside phosphorylase